MGVNEEKGPIELHIEKSLESLKKRAANVNDSKMTLYKQSFLKLLDNLNVRIKDANMNRDNELEYIYLYRFIQVCTKMSSTPDTNNKVNKKDLKKYASCGNKHMNRLENLESILKDRYNELNLKKSIIIADLASSQIIETNGRNETKLKQDIKQPENEPLNGFMDSTKLYSILDKNNKSQKPSMLLIDIRVPAEFKGSRVVYEEIINLPNDTIHKGMSAAKLQYQLDEKYKSLWKKRHSYDIVLLLDKSSTKSEINDSILTLKDIMTNWDIKGNYKSLVILDGGFEDFQIMYPNMTTNPKYISFNSLKPTQDILMSLDYPEVPEYVPPNFISTTKVTPSPKEVTPTINRLMKPKAGFTALIEFKEKEMAKQVDDSVPTKPIQDRGEPAQAGQPIDPRPVVTPNQESHEPTVTPMEESSSSSTMDVEEPAELDLTEREREVPDLTIPSPHSTIVHSYHRDGGGEKIKSILKPNESTMSDKEKAAYVENLRKVKPKSSDNWNPPVTSTIMDYSSSSDEDERVPLKRDGVGSSSNMKRSLSSPNIAKAKDDDIISTPSFSRSNKPNYSLRAQPTPFILGENIDAVYGKTQVGLTGLKNFANNCYMNSILQCLSNTEPLVRELINLNKPALNSGSSTKGQIANVFITALRSIWSGEIKVYSIRELKNLMGNYKEIFKGSNHQDSHEFLIILLEYLHDDLNIPSEVTNLTGASESSGEKAWGEFRKKNQSIIQHLFYGQEQSSVTCKTCSHKSVTFDHFFNLSVPIPDSDRTTLEECIQVYLTGENIIWTCPKCKVDRSAVKKLDITRLPPILIIALKRFSQEGQSSWLEKKETLVTYPLENLDLRSITLPGSEQRHTKYNLHALSTHTGTLRTGHYRAICQNYLTTKWYLFDDSSVHLISPQDVRNSPEVYILFYHAVK